MAKRPARPRRKRPPRKKPPYYFDADAAAEACGFFPKYLRHVIGQWAGQSFELLDWQRERVVEPLFGWRRTADGLRKFRTCYLEIPRKNAKSTLAAGLALKLVYADGEAAAEIYSCAADKDQAKIIFNIARRMVESHPVLEERARVYRDIIVIPKTGNEYKALSADAMTKHGFNAHGIIFDELHAQPNRELWDVMTTSTGARRQPLTVACTTAGHDRNSICWEQHEYAVKLLAGEIEDETFLPVVYAAPADADPFKPATWAACNPSLGKTISVDYFQAKAREALLKPSSEGTFRRLHLNQWTSTESAWIPADVWDRCAGDFDFEELLGRRCYGGLDLATKRDIAAYVLLFPPDDSIDYFTCLCYFWIPRDNLADRVRTSGRPLDRWEREGFIEATPGNLIDFQYIRRRILESAELFDIQTIGYDEWNATQLASELDALGVPVVQYRQGMKSLSPPTKELEDMIYKGPERFQHGGNPVLDWMAASVVIRTDDAENKKPVKKKSKDKIDGITALIMALGCYMTEEGPAAPSIYETSGLTIL